MALVDPTDFMPQHCLLFVLVFCKLKVVFLKFFCYLLAIIHCVSTLKCRSTFRLNVW